MQDFSFVCLSHPLAEAYLDDDQNFLNTLAFEFRHKETFTFTSPAALQETLEKQVDPIEKVLYFCSMAVADNVAQRQIKFSILDFHKLIYDESRFKAIVLAIVDYDMPEMNGIEFCQHIKEKNVYKILLTANEDKDLAIDAFNAGTIDKFIMKQVRELFTRLETALMQLKQRYFADITKPLLPSLGAEINALAKNIDFLTLCRETYASSSAVEYYLMDKSGSYLFLDKDANPTWLLVRNEKDFAEQIQMLQGFDGAGSLLADLEKRGQLLFLLSESEYKKPIVEWEQHLFSCQRLDNSDVYYAVVQEKVSDVIEWNKVKSFQEVLQKKESD